MRTPHDGWTFSFSIFSITWPGITWAAVRDVSYALPVQYKASMCCLRSCAVLLGTPPDSESREAVTSFIDARRLTGLGSLPFHRPGVDE